jgi:ERCC4-type nuclease
MIDLVIKETDTTPEVIMSSEKSLLSIKGNSYPENPNDFYHPILISKKEFLRTALQNIIIDINLNYFNTSSNKFIINLLRDFVSEKPADKKISINWHFDIEDSDMEQRGSELSSIINHPFNLISFKSDD